MIRRQGNETWERNMNQCHIINQKSNNDWPETEVGPPRYKAGY